MTNKPVTEENLVRLAKAIMEKHHVGYDEACRMLSNMRLFVVCDTSITTSIAKQAALLTILNCGKRAFHGGVYVKMPHHVPCLLPWPSLQPFNSIVSMLGGCFAMPDSDGLTQTIYLGVAPNPVEDSLSVFCSGWVGGIAPGGTKLAVPTSPDFATGGVLAGGLAVAAGFLRVSSVASHTLKEPYGISLWRPDLHFLDPVANGPHLESLPKALWFLGLGHLGQAYLWNFGLLPYRRSDEPIFVLQDYDKVVGGNYFSQLLSEHNNISQMKTRVCSAWLEPRGFKTVLIERPFDENTKRTGDEPFIALCGFDKAKPRRSLENAGFDLIVECALGGNAARFDRIVLHTFPNARRGPAEIWANDDIVQADPRIVMAFAGKDHCGIVAETLAKKAISSSFVGAVAGALATAELLRAFNSGIRCELIQAHLRNNEPPGVIVKNESYGIRVARSGYCASALSVMA